MDFALSTSLIMHNADDLTYFGSGEWNCIYLITACAPVPKKPNF